MADLNDIIQEPLYSTSGFTPRTCHSMISNNEEDIERYNENSYNNFRLIRDDNGSIEVGDFFNNNNPTEVVDGQFFKCPGAEAGRNSTTEEGICNYCGKPISADIATDETLSNSLKFSIDKANVSLNSSLSQVSRSIEFETSQIKLNINYNPTTSINETLELVDVNNETRATFTRN